MFLRVWCLLVQTAGRNLWYSLFMALYNVWCYTNRTDWSRLASTLFFYSRIRKGALRDGDLVDLVLTGGQTRHPRPVVLRLLDVVVLPQLAEHLVHAEEGGTFAEWSVLQDRGQVHHPPVIIGSAPTPVQHLVIGSLEQTVSDIISEYCQSAKPIRANGNHRQLNLWPC